MKGSGKGITVTVIAVAVFTVSVFFYYSGFFERLDGIAYDKTVKHLRLEKRISDDIAVILIDETSIDALAGKVGRWPWPRAIYSQLFGFLAMGEARAVFMDILFTETQDPRKESGELGDDDMELVAGTMRAGFVYHAMQVLEDSEDEKNKGLLNRPLPEDFVSKFSVKNLKLVNSVPSLSNIYYIPFDELYRTARGMAVVEFAPDIDGIYRRTKLFREYRGTFLPVPGIAPLIENQPVEIGDKSLKIGGRNIPLDKDGKFIINVYGNFDSYSISGIFASIAKIEDGDVENLMVHPMDFKDKIVYVGGSAVGVEDLKPTPISPKTPGVYLHASLASNFLLDDFLVPPNRTATLLALLLFTAICVPGIFYMKSFAYKIFLPTAILVAWIGFFYYQLSNNHLYEIIPPIFAILFSSISSFGYLVLTEGREKQKVRKMFSQYVSEDVLSMVMDQYGDMAKSGGTKEDVSVLFSDIRNFTTFSDKRPPEKVVEMLNCYFSHMSDIIFLNGGTIDKFIGDAIMAFWGAPIKMDDHPDRAVTAAIGMIHGLRKVNEEIKKMDVGDFELKIGIGINSGHAIIGNIGSEKKLDYTIIGDTVNLASRLESLTKNYGVPIIISEFTRERLNEDFPCRIIDMVKVRGREDRTKIYEPLIVDGEESREQAQKLCDITNNAFIHYAKSDFKTALELYGKIEDGVLKNIFINRCEKALETGSPLETRDRRKIKRLE